MVWTIELTGKAEKQLAKLDRQTARRITQFLQDRVRQHDNPRELGKALTGDRLGSYWRYRVGDYRIICEIFDDRLVVLVLKVAHRREVYD